MSEVLRPDGSMVRIAGVILSSQGVGGVVAVHTPGSRGMRAAEAAQPLLLEAMDRAGLIEQLTVEISDLRAFPEFLETAEQGRGAETRAPELTLTVPGAGAEFGQVLLACDESGVITWHLPVDVDPSALAMRGGERCTFRVPAQVREIGESGQRGLIGALGKKLLKVLFFGLADKALGAAGKYFVSRYEAAHMPHRLRAFTLDNYRHSDVPDLDAQGLHAISSGRALLFIHGTGSRTHKAFALLPPDFVTALVKRYDGRVFALDHPTLSVTPLENVRWLAKALAVMPADQHFDIDVIAHSRGGLVGRVLCELPGAAGLDTARLQVRTLVMVASPNAGTPLADRKHVGAFIDTLTNCLEFLPDNPATNVLDVLLELVKQVAIGVTGKLEGLKSMDPKGDFLRQQLNQPSPVTATYRAMAANFEPGPGSPLGRFARDCLADLVFAGKENDLVVPTDGVFAANGASGFPILAPLRLGASAMVDHSGFWTNPAALHELSQWLELPGGPVA